MSKKKKKPINLQLLDQTRDRSVRPRSTVFKDKSKYNRQRAKQELRKEQA